MKRILILDKGHPILIEKLSEAGFIIDIHTDWSREEVISNIENYEGIIVRSKLVLDSEIIDKANRLRWIARIGAGMDAIDVDYAESKGIVCLNSPEGNRTAVGEHALGLLLCLFDKLIVADREVRQGLWQREANRGLEIEGKTIGIIGYGNMGRSFAKRLSGFDCKVLAYDKYKKGYSDDYAT
ncbi:MAG: NAD(P)-dependent oxidoreductase, partial [Bacteroidales bacterium]|nr:NAD(P)-dependent oxidoreductase [Bacteroidales bacterium]